MLMFVVGPGARLDEWFWWIWGWVGSVVVINMVAFISNVALMII